MPVLNTFPSLWDFALAFYAKPQVAETCIDLQDTYECNVCLLIGLGWVDVRKKYLSEEDLAHLESYIQPWTQQVVVPLRNLRRLLKHPVAVYAQDDTQVAVRNLIKQAELSAEKKLLAEIESWLIQFPVTTKADSGSNVANYLQKLATPELTIEFIQKNFSIMND